MIGLQPDTPGIVDAFVEIPKYSQNKYEYDHERQCFRLDRTLYSPVHYPTDYGFIPNTLGEDGDPLDILVIISVPTFPGCMVRARVVGALQMVDEKGVDTKILSVSVTDPRYEEINDIHDVPAHVQREIEYFFAIYKDLEDKTTKVDGWYPFEDAMKWIEEGFQRAAKQHR